MMQKLKRHLQARGVKGTFERLNKCYQENGLQYTLKQILSPLSSVQLNVSMQKETTVPAVKKQTPEDAAVLYMNHNHDQGAYLKSYKNSPTKHRIASLLNLLKSERNYKGVVLYPLSYDINVKQRPEHILRVLAEEGYLCLILKIGADMQATMLQKLGKRLYYTDLFEEAITYFSERSVYLYITTPFFYYLTNHLKKGYVIYDVLDDLKIFANYCKPMEIDHRELLRRSNAVTYSSKVMQEKLEKGTNAAILLENGVWPNDFQISLQHKPKHVDADLPHLNEIKVGYHGVVSELLNYDIIESILEHANADVYLIGPIATFDASKELELQKRINELKKYRNFHLLGFIPYENLVYYLQQFDYSIIPFYVSEATDAVSPLKLFESLACGRSVLATATKTLVAYDGLIHVLPPEDFADFVAQRKGLDINEAAYKKIVVQNSWSNLVRPLLSHMENNVSRPNGTVSARVKQGKTTVDIININFFDWKGDVLYKGGAERYVYDLAKMCQGMNFEVRIMQHGQFYFSKVYDGIPVIGVPSHFDHKLANLSEYYNSYCAQTDLIITSPLDLACQLNPEQTIIGINHGIYWDDRHTSLYKHNVDRYKNVFDALKNVDACACVDTNFINWARTYDWEMAQKCEFVPNYVDLELFRPVIKDFDGDLIISYPRRLYEARGLYITIEAFETLLKKYPQLKLHLVGQADERDTIATEKFISRFPEQVSWYELDMHNMHQAYERSHIVLVPTLYAEGTSLSCIEAMATNNAIIATTVGGLPNLIIHRHNGLLIKPNTEDLLQAIESLIQDRLLLKLLAKNALATAPAFNKADWLKRWTGIITQTLGEKVSYIKQKEDVLKK